MLRRDFGRMINISATSKCRQFHYLQICFVCWAERPRFCSIAGLLLFCFNCILMFHDWAGAQINQKNFSSTTLYKPLSLPFIQRRSLFRPHDTLRITFIVLSLSFLQQTLSLYASAANTSYLDEGGIVVWTLMIGLGDYKKFTSSKTGKMPPIL